MGAPRHPGSIARRAELGSITTEHTTTGEARYRARYRNRYVGSFKSLEVAQAEIDRTAANDTEPRKKVGRKVDEDGKIERVVLASIGVRYRARYRSKYLGTHDTTDEAKRAIAGHKARLAGAAARLASAAANDGTEGSSENPGTSGASPDEKT